MLINEVLSLITFLLVQSGLVQRMISHDSPIPRKLLFSTPERSMPKLSPDGKYLSFFAPNSKGVKNVWLQENAVAGAKPFPVTFDEGSGISSTRFLFVPPSAS